MRVFATRLVAALGCAILAGCGATVDSDGGPRLDGGGLPDAPVSIDAGRDTALDAPELDSSIDASEPDAAACECPTPPPCFVARCEEGRCLEEALEDGTTCGEDMSQHCVSAECVTRTCGDGFRETSGPLREGCDDGNRIDGDGCSSTCAPTVVFPVWETDEHFVADAPAVAVPDRRTGQDLLVVWVQQQRSTAMRTLHARMGDREYVLEGPRSWIAEPVAVADPRGFVVAYETLDGVGVHRITFDGDVRAIAPTGSAADRDPALSATDDGFVLAWRAADRIWLREHRGGVRSEARGVVVGATGTVSIAASGRDGVVVWESEGELLARAFTEGVPSGDPYVVASSAASASVTTVGGDFEVAWTSFEDDFFGDVWIGARSDVAVHVASSDVRERSRGIAPYGSAWIELHEVGPFALPVLAFADGVFVAPELEVVVDALRFADPQTTALARAPGGVVVAWVGFTGGGPQRQLATFFLPDS